MALSFGFALPNAGNNFRGDIFSQLLPADQRVEAASGTQEVANGCLDNRVVELRAIMPEVTNTNLLFNSSMAGATGSVLPTNWASGSVSGLTYTISSASTVQGFRSIEWTVSGTALSDGDLWLACEPMQSGTVSAQIPSEYVGSMYCAKVSGTIKAGMVLQTLTQNFINGAVQETITKDLAAVTGQTFVRIEPNSVKTDVDLENRVNLRLYQSIASGEVIDFTIRVAAPQVEAGVTASPFISTVSGAVSEVRGRPSILIVPQLTKSGVVYPQLPVVSGADFTFTRATTATRVNASGLIESVASGLLRLDYPVTGGCPAALIEASATNLLLRSEEFSVSGTWTLVTGGTGVNPVVTPNAAISPDGTQSADNIVLNVGSGTLSTDVSIIRQNITVSAVAYTYSIWLKSNTGTNQFVSLRFNSAPSQEVTITNDWQRFTFTGTPASGSRDFGLDLRGNNTSGQKICNILAWGAQVETGAIPTSYIPTTTAAVTRAADVCTVSGVSGLIGQTEGTIYVEGIVTNYADAAASFITVSDNSITNRLEIRKASPNLIILERNSTTQSGSTSISLSGQGSGTFKMAVSYISGNTVFFVNGVQVGATNTDTFTMNTLTHVYLGSNATGSARRLNDRIRAAALYTTRLSNAQLAELTRL